GCGPAGDGAGSDGTVAEGAGGEAAGNENLEKARSAGGVFGYLLNEAGNGIVLAYYTGAGGAVTIPAEIEGLPVVDIGTVFADNEKITSVVIPEGVTEIKRRAFNGCKALHSITFPKSLRTIAGGVYQYSWSNLPFYDTRLTSLEIPEGVTSIGDAAFYEIDHLASVSIPASVTSIGNSVFFGCDSLGSVTIAGNTTDIGQNAFYNCKNLSSLIIPAGITNIGNGAFGGDYKLPLEVRKAIVSVNPQATRTTVAAD
ncbi:MAG: leucine-rich repeat domain-containing protein, partial [Treponema sp.]|nr:leucine-rich repeat domain-containing protein [Treponema sp.]